MDTILRGTGSEEGRGDSRQCRKPRLGPVVPRTRPWDTGHRHHAAHRTAHEDTELQELWR